MKVEHTWNVWSDDLTESLKILLLRSLQILHKLAAGTKSQITVIRLLKELHLQEDQIRFTSEDSRGRCNFRQRVI